MRASLNSSLEASCPWLARRWSREQRGMHPSEDNACFLWEECGVPPDVVQYCAGTMPWHGERFVPVPVETQWSICLTGHYGSCRWLRERQWYTRETALVCPLLGSPADRHHKYLYPCNQNVCHAHKAGLEEEPGERKAHALLTIARSIRRRKKTGGTPLPSDRQRTICLTKHYAECKLYLENLPAP